MLVRLSGRNFRSFKDDFELSLVAADLKRKEDANRGVIEVELEGLDEPLRLLRTVGIYGPNASGKSSVLLAAHALNWMVEDSSPRSKPGALIPPYEPFALDLKCSTEPILLSCDVICENKLLRYSIEYTKQKIESEKLAWITAEGEELLIDRHSKQISGILIDRSDANRLYTKEMQPNVAVLSKLAQHGPQEGPESVQPYFQAIRRATRVEDYTHTASGTRVLFADDPFVADADYRRWVIDNLMRAADLGICDVQTSKKKFEIAQSLIEHLEKLPDLPKPPEEQVVVSFVHQGKLRKPMELSEESAGTRKLFNLAAEWWRLATEPTTLFADELSASLHPRLLDRLIRSVNEPSNPNIRSQLIFATHDTGLLESQDGNPPALRRDQVYFTQKNENGESELYSLAEFKEDARPVHNLRKRYLSGLYGALPLVKKLGL